MKMEDEEQVHNASTSSSACGRNGGNGRHPKRQKVLKIPQRGPGVAKLEQMRLEEQVKNEDVGLQSPSPAITPQPTGILYSRSPSLPVSPSDPFFSDGVHGHIPSNPQQLKVGHHGIVPVSANGATPGNGYPLAFFATEGNGNNLSCSGYTRGVEKSPRTPHNTIAFTGLMQQGNQQYCFCPPSIVNGLVEISSSSVSSFQAEPPSNQSPYGTYHSVQPDDTEKMVAAKELCLLLPQDQPDPSALCKSNPTAVPSSGRSTSFANPSAYATNGTLRLREGLQCSISMPNMRQRKDIRTDWPPATMYLLPISDSKHVFQPELHSIPSQVHVQGSNSEGVYNVSTFHQQQGTFNTFSTAPNNAPYGQSIVSSDHNNNGENGDKVDLNNNNNNGETEDKVDLELKL
ncbi:hypothetical protein QQ045_009362 [Rhodiola kirilowii]